MIYTLTLSPAIDYTLNLTDKFLNEKINRSYEEHYEIGGKGINVSILLNNLGSETTALGFLGGFTGDYIKRVLNEKEIKNDFCILKGNTRINIKINEFEKESAINANGPKISKENINNLFEKIEKIKEGDTLILAGNIPTALSSDIYEKILEKIKDKKVNIVVDSTKVFLLNTLKYRPFLIKPNLEELEEIFETKIVSNKDIVEKAKKLQDLGARNILISLGAEGAILVDENKNIYNQKTFIGKVVSTVGSGDSMVAGFVHKYNKTSNFEKALSFGIACGAATAFSEGIAEVPAILKILKEGKKCE